MGKYKTKLEREHLDKVSQLGCICCGAIAEIHHIRDKVGMGRRSSHFETLPLCPIHHRLGKDSIHLGKKNFIKKFKNERELLKKVREILDAQKTEPFI